MFEAAWKQHGAKLYGYALSLLGRPEDAEDALQQVFLSLVRREDASPPEHLRAYLYRATRNEALRLQRRRREVLGVQEEALLVGAPQDRREIALDVSRALAALPEEQREVAILKLYHEHTFEAIGELLEISPNTAASRYRYALIKLRESLETRGEEVPSGRAGS